jgi:hypothetical protein
LAAINPQERNFKAYYLEKMQTQWQNAFPGLVSYGRFAFVNTQHLAAFVCLSAFLLRTLHRHQFPGCDQPQGLPQPSHQPAQGVQKSGGTRQNLR